jgi:hypothetical protein
MAAAALNMAGWLASQRVGGGWRALLCNRRIMDGMAGRHTFVSAAISGLFGQTQIRALGCALSLVVSFSCGALLSLLFAGSCLLRVSCLYPSVLNEPSLMRQHLVACQHVIANALLRLNLHAFVSTRALSSLQRSSAFGVRAFLPAFLVITCGRVAGRAVLLRSACAWKTAVRST